jgi:hypothetical protein
MARESLEQQHVRIAKWVDNGLTEVNIGDLLAREGVVVPARTLHRCCVERTDYQGPGAQWTTEHCGPPEMEEVKRAVFPYAPNPVEVRAMSPTKNHAVAAIGAPQVTTLSVRCRKADAFRGRHVGGSVERRRI